MATTTSNYKLTKPAYTDTPDIAVINTNMDTIDTQLKTVANAATNATNAVNNLVKITRLPAQSLTAAGGSLTFSDSSITTTSLIDVYATIPNIAPSAISAAAGTCTVTFDAQSAAFDVTIAVIN